MLTTIFSSLGGVFIDKFMGSALEAFKAYNNKVITIEELRTKLLDAAMAAFKEIEQTHADLLAKTFASFMQTMVQSKLMQRVWALVTLSQLAVLLWHQAGIPAIVALGIVKSYPSSGSTVEWAYALVGACVGMGPLVLRTGPGAGSIKDQLAGLLRK